MGAFFKRFFCRHAERRFIRNIYGDEINHFGGKRSLWRCLRCGAVVTGDFLHHGANNESRR